jgi:hypothetical protein
VERPRAEPQQSKLGQVNIELTGLRFGQNRRGVAAFDGTTLKHGAEGVDPFSFDAIGKHFVLFFRRQTEDFTDKDDAMPMQSSVRIISPRLGAKCFGAHQTDNNLT